MIDYESFIKNNLGKAVEREDSTNLNQCFDWAFAYLDDVLEVPRSSIRHLRAYEIWTLATDETKKYFDLIPNSPIAVPQKGDIVVFGTAVGVSGHVCIASGNNQGTTQFQSTDQNWGNHSFVEYIWHNYVGVFGWLRKKQVAPIPPTIDWQKKYNDEVTAHNATTKEFNDYKSSAEADKNKAVAEALKALNDKIDAAQKL